MHAKYGTKTQAQDKSNLVKVPRDINSSKVDFICANKW